MNYKAIIAILSLCFAAPTITVNAQETNDKQFYVYLWDVTLSMLGPERGGVEDVWDSTKEWLINEIKSRKTNPGDTIVVCPFQECIISGDTGLKRIDAKTVVPRPYVSDATGEPMTYDSPWKFPATPNGKRELIKKIESFVQPHHGKTNLYDPLMDTKRDYVDMTKHSTTIYMLTDGIDDFNENTDKSFIKEINEKWSKRDPLLIYIRLTDAACADIKPSDNVEIINPKERLIEISATVAGKYNFIDAVKENRKTQTININQVQKNYELPKGIKIKVTSDNNPYVKIDDVCEVVDGKIEVKLKYNQQTVDENIYSNSTIDLNFNVDNDKLISDDGYVYIISLSNTSSKTLELVNKVQKTLKIKLRKAEPIEE